MKYDYIIPIRIRFVNPHWEGSFKEHMEWFNSCVKEYNEKCSRSTVNCKKIEVVEANDEDVRINLYSEVNLTKAPGRAMVLLSRLLIDEKADGYDPFFSDRLFHGKLFVTETINAPSDTIQISDGDLIKSLIDYVTRAKGYYTPEGHKRAVDEMKRIAVESGLYDKEKSL